MGGFNSSNMLQINVTKYYREEVSVFFHEKLSNSSELYYLEPSIDGSISDVVEALNMFSWERNNDSQKNIRVEVSRRTHKVENYPEKDESSVAFFCIGLGQVSLAMELELCWKEEDIANENLIIRTDSFINYTDLIEQKMLLTQMLPFLVAFLLIQSWKLGTI